jgi:hypothetical protein
MVAKTLKELVTLVVASLEPPAVEFAGEEEGEGGGTVMTQLQVKADSLLSEADAGSSDLGSIIAALMHHVPALRHRHVAVSQLSFPSNLLRRRCFRSIISFETICIYRMPFAEHECPRQQLCWGNSGQTAPQRFRVLFAVALMP